MRKKSIAPASFRLRDLKGEDDLDFSPQNSVTSINSIASLLKEKLMVIFFYANLFFIR